MSFKDQPSNPWEAGNYYNNGPPQNLDEDDEAEVVNPQDSGQDNMNLSQKVERRSESQLSNPQRPYSDPNVVYSLGMSNSQPFPAKKMSDSQTFAQQ